MTDKENKGADKAPDWEGRTIRQRVWEFTRQFEGLEKSRKMDAGKMKYDYFNIDDVYNAAIPLMTECGIIAIDHIEQQQSMVDGSRWDNLVITLDCIENTDASAYVIKSVTEIPKGKDMRAYGSALTYLRRYVLCTMLNIRAPGEDDDAQTQALSVIENESGGVSETTIQMIEQLIIETKSERSDVLEFVGANYGVELFTEMSKREGAAVLRILEAKRKKDAQNAND